MPRFTISVLCVRNSADMLTQTYGWPVMLGGEWQVLEWWFVFDCQSLPYKHCHTNAANSERVGICFAKPGLGHAHCRLRAVRTLVGLRTVAHVQPVQPDP